MLSTILFITFIASSRGNPTVPSVPLWNPNDPKCKGSKLLPTDTLKPLEFLLSENCIFQLIMQEDGNLVIYKNVVGFKKATWSIKKYGDQYEGDYLVYQEDGNVCVRNPLSSSAEWCSGSYGGDLPTVLAMQDDGNFVAYKEHGKASWASETEESIPPGANACFTCTNVQITDWEIVNISPNPESRKTNQDSFKMEQCGLPANKVDQTVSRTTTTDVTQSYQWSKSMSSTFSTSMSSSISISATAGFKMMGVDASVSTTASVDTSKSFSHDQSSTSNKAMTTETVNTLQKTYSLSLFYPANKITTHYIFDLSYQGTLEWKANATCYSKDNVLLETQKITGTYKDVQFDQVVNDHDECDCSADDEPINCIGKKFPGKTPAPDSTPAPTPASGDSGDSGSSSNNRCGKDWATANSSCGNKACPDGTDAPCPDGQKCYADVKECDGGFVVLPEPTPAPVAKPTPAPVAVADVCQKLTRGACRRNPLCSNRSKGCMNKKAMNRCKKYTDNKTCSNAGCKPRTKQDGSFKKCRPGN